MWRQQQQSGRLGIAARFCYNASAIEAAGVFLDMRILLLFELQAAAPNQQELLVSWIAWHLLFVFTYRVCLPASSCAVHAGWQHKHSADPTHTPSTVMLVRYYLLFWVRMHPTAKLQMQDVGAAASVCKLLARQQGCVVTAAATRKCVRAAWWRLHSSRSRCCFSSVGGDDGARNLSSDSSATFGDWVGALLLRAARLSHSRPAQLQQQRTACVGRRWSGVRRQLLRLHPPTMCSRRRRC